MIRALLPLLVLSLLAAACGGEPPPAEDEVTETWTAGDDAPLDAPDAGAD